MKEISGVYTITCTANGRRYVGSSHDCEARWYGHKNALGRNAHINSRLQYDWNRHGPGAFEFTIITEVQGKEQMTRTENALLEMLGGEAYNTRPAYIHARGGNLGLVCRLRALIEAKELRENRQYSLQEIAKATNVSGKTLRSMLDGNGLGFVWLRHVVQVCDWLECDVSDLLAMEPDSK